MRPVPPGPSLAEQAALKRPTRDSAETQANIVVNEARIGALKKEAAKGNKSFTGSSELISLTAELNQLKKELKPPCIMVEDFTLEALRNVMAINESQISIVSDDAGKPIQNLLGANNKLQMPEDVLMLKGYTGTDFICDRVSSGNIFIKKAWCSLFWLAQPDKIDLLTKNVWLDEGGFIPRCLMARFASTPSVQSDADVSPTLMDDYCGQRNRVFDKYRAEFTDYQTARTLSESPNWQRSE